MANWCDIYMQIVCKNEEEAQKLENVLEQEIEQAEKEARGLFFGSKSRYFFSYNLQREEQTLIVCGEVRWALETDEMADWTRFFVSKAKIQSISVEYEEMGCEIFGRYTYDGKQLYDTCIPYELYPQYDEENEEYYPALNEILEKHGTEVFIDEIIAA